MININKSLKVAFECLILSRLGNAVLILTAFLIYTLVWNQQNMVVRFLVSTRLGMALLLLFGAFDLLVTGLIIARGTTRHVIEDLGLAQHSIVVVTLVSLFRFFLWLLRLWGKLEIHVNAPIPWNEECLIFVGNHALPKLQDTFINSATIYALDSRNPKNPIRHFPVSAADKVNFFESKFFRLLFGNDPHSLIAIDRTAKGRANGLKDFVEQVSEKVVKYRGILINYLEGGRTQSAKNFLETEKGSKLGEPRPGTALAAMKYNLPVVPFYDRLVKVSCCKFDPDVLGYKLLEFILKKPLRMFGFYDERPKAGNGMVALGLVELFLNPELRVIIDFNHPAGVIRPRSNEDSKHLTSRIAENLLNLGDYQIDRIERSRKQ